MIQSGFYLIIIHRCSPDLYFGNDNVYLIIIDKAIARKSYLFPPVGFIPRGLPRLLNENPYREPRPLAAGSFIFFGVGGQNIEKLLKIP